MRPLAALLLVLAAFAAWAQQPDPTEPEKQEPTSQELMNAMTAPQLSVQIRHHADAASYVLISMVTPDYPEEILRDQIAELGRQLGSDPRGLEIGQTVTKTRDGKNLSFLRASFAVDDVIDPVTRKFELNALIRSFLGAAEPHTITSLQLIFQGETPIPNRTLDKYSDNVVTLVGTFYDNPKSIEYRVMTRTQNPEEINIPLDKEEAEKPKPVSPVGPARPTPILIGIILLAGVALGALVYFAMLRTPKA